MPEQSPANGSPRWQPLLQELVETGACWAIVTANGEDRAEVSSILLAQHRDWVQRDQESGLQVSDGMTAYWACDSEPCWSHTVSCSFLGYGMRGSAYLWGLLRRRNGIICVKYPVVSDTAVLWTVATALTTKPENNNNNSNNKSSLWNVTYDVIYLASHISPLPQSFLSFISTSLLL